MALAGGTLTLTTTWRDPPKWNRLRRCLELITQAMKRKAPLAAPGTRKMLDGM